MLEITPVWGSSKKKKTNTSSEQYIYGKANWNGFRDELKGKKLEQVIVDLPTEEAWGEITKTLESLKDKYIPKRNTGPSCRKQYKPLWANPAALAKVKRKKHAWQRYLATKDGNDYDNYVTERNQARKEVRKAVRNFEKSIAKKCKTNPKAFWSYVSSKVKTRQTLSHLSNNNRLYFSDADKAELLNEFFSSVYTEEDINNIPRCETPENPPIMNDINITPETVLKKLKKLDPKKAPGPDNIATVLLKEAASEMSVILCALFKKSIAEGTVPNVWKTANVTPIFKSGDKTLPQNYRPISLTSQVCKILESIIVDDINKHMQTHNLATPNQYGFTKGKSCKTNIIDCEEDWTSAIDKGYCVDIIYLDLKKAFDKVPHKRLLNKLKSYGITGPTHTWITDFLTGRSQKVVINGNSSTNASVKSGVPQGSVLGPCLFSIFVNDMPDIVVSNLRLFADDGKLYRVIHTRHDCETLQSDLDALGEWASKWQLTFNTDKCLVLRLGRNPPPFLYTMKPPNSPPVTLNVTVSARDLGITIRNDLKTREQTTSVIAKANRVLYTIRRTMSHLTYESGPTLYKSLVRPILEYGNTAWSPLTVDETEKIEQVQRRATRWICRHENLSYPERLQRLDLPSLTHRRRRGDLIELYKYFKDPSQFNSLRINISRTNTRGHNYKIVKERWSTSTRKNFFHIKCANDWNSLPAEIVNSPNLPIFKNRLDKYLRGQDSVLNHRATRL